jgi:hypothetical protein
MINVYLFINFGMEYKIKESKIKVMIQPELMKGLLKNKIKFDFNMIIKDFVRNTTNRKI